MITVRQKIPDPAMPSGWRDFVIPASRVLTVAIRLTSDGTATAVRGLVSDTADELLDARNIVSEWAENRALVVDVAELPGGGFLMIAAWEEGVSHRDGYIKLPPALYGAIWHLAEFVLGLEPGGIDGDGVLVDQSTDLTEFNYVV